MYTTIHELVENSLDACESVYILPDIVVKIEEMTMDEFNKVRGVMGIEKKSITTDGTGVNDCNGIKDVGLFQKATPKKRTEKKKTKIKDDEGTTQGKISAKAAAVNSASRASGKRDAEAYFRISVKDNGCGMKHEAIPNLLGIVLSGSKYGVRQTRGKFGLGAKMALIWSKKSTGGKFYKKSTSSHNIAYWPCS